MRPTRRAFVAGATALAGAAAAGPSLAAPRSQLLDARWTASGAAAQPDPSPFDAVLAARRRVGSDGIARFDYGGVTAAERGALDGYFAALQAAAPTAMRRDEAFAFWSNLYNVGTLVRVLDAYPVTSIRRIGGTLFAPGPWRDRTLTVEGQALSLDDVEHGILRPIWRDPRVHYAVNCAALGCPNLGARAWRADTLDADLDAAARAFVNHPRGAEVSSRGLRVSSIYEWFQEDFGGSDAGVIDHLRRYADAPLADALVAVDQIAADAYDWALNDAS